MSADAWPPAPYSTAIHAVSREATWLTEEPQPVSGRSSQWGPARTRWQHNGGLGGAVARGIYGKPAPRLTQGDTDTTRHLPVARELAQASAALLVGTAPGVMLHPDDAGNERAGEFLSGSTAGDEWASSLQRAAMMCSALGWVFARVVWNTDVQPSPWVEFVDADHGFVKWANGRPTEFVFWDVLPDPEGRENVVWRLLQVHKPGRIEYALHRGTATTLGVMQPLPDHPQAAHLADIVDEQAGIPTGTMRLTAAVINNVDGRFSWRGEPQLRNLGLGDVAAGGSVWADIDAFYSALVHEVTLARGRLLVSEELLETLGPGRGSAFDFGRDVFALSQAATDHPPTIEQVQFQMRVREHLEAIDGATRKALDAVGLSPITVGMDDGSSSALTATEIRARSRRTLSTWEQKARSWRAGLGAIITAWVDVDAALNGYAPLQRPVNVALTPPVEESELDRARAVRELRDAEAASTEYLVRRLHPEWTDEEQAVEVARIREERGLTEDPLDLTRFGD